MPEKNRKMPRGSIYYGLEADVVTSTNGAYNARRGAVLSALSKYLFTKERGGGEREKERKERERK